VSPVPKSDLLHREPELFDRRRPADFRLREDLRRENWSGRRGSNPRPRPWQGSSQASHRFYRVCVSLRNPQKTTASALFSFAVDWRGLLEAASYLLATLRSPMSQGIVMAKQKLGLRQVRALQPGQTTWDTSVAGFGARRQKGNGVAYVLFYRTEEGRQRWFTIGRHGSPWTPETARSEAQRLLGDVKKGTDPASTKRAKRQAATISELCDQYLADAQAGRLLTRRKVAKKASTLAIDVGRIERHIKPLIGQLRVTSVTREDVDAFMHDVAEGKTAGRIKTTKKRGLARVRGGKGAASRAVGLLGGIFSYAVKHRMRPDNPVQGIARFADGKRDRRLGDDEYMALGDTLRKAEGIEVWPVPVAVARFLALTGWRSGEALALRKSEIDLARRTAILPDSKTGRSMRPLPRAACDLLKTLKHGGELVFPPTRGTKPLSGFAKSWERIAELGTLPSDITPHVFRHSFQSLASDLGYSEATIRALVGHKGRSITSRYVHSADAVLLAAADAVADRTEQLMQGVVVTLKRAQS
jgi:integrase